ncbi:MAG TPA: pirin family protein [Alphaproteobacteria bacterium]|jgi:redox-sensitive bicupin YhaK (pirin superfamily)|nr:pirin family protein [Alphaproteobacteria bacterium]
MSRTIDRMPEAPNGASRRVARVVRGRPASDGAGVRLTRVIGSPELPDLDPFLMLDEFRSDDAQDYLAGFPDHPHRGFETVTYMLAGRMRHGDNKGNSGLLLPGGAQWMTAGRGIVHSEMPEQEDGLMWGFQLWVNLPGRDKMAAPRYQDIEPAAIPEVDLPGGAHARVVAGSLANASGPAKAVATEPLYLDITLPDGAAADIPVPASHAAFAYVYDGAARIGPKGAAHRLGRGELAVLGVGAHVEISADKGGGRLILVAGKPLGEPVAKYGPFVMNTYDEIRQAVVDFQAGRF